MCYNTYIEKYAAEWIRKEIRMKRFALLIAMVFLLLATACAPTFEGGKPFDGEQLSSGEVRYNVVGEVGYLRWDGTDGADGYLVTRSATRFGEFTPETTTAETSYEVEDGLFDYFQVIALKGEEEHPLGEPVCALTNTLVVGPDDDMAAVQAHIDEVHSRLETANSGQFSSERFAVLLLPGEYPDLDLKVGYYTSVSGLGTYPYEVTVGKLSVSLKVLANSNSTCTFWRGAENMTVLSDTVWAVSQATYLRRMSFLGDLSLSGSGWSSGGFLADSTVQGVIHAGTQQQWFTRNTAFKSWDGNSYNYVFTGCEGQIPSGNWSSDGTRTTILPSTERIAEKPFLTNTDGEYNLFIPDFSEDAVGCSWKNNKLGGYFAPLEEFYIANEKTDTAATLNDALARGYSIFFPAGRYRLDAPLKVCEEGTLLLGSGYATLEISDENPVGALQIADVGGVRVAGLLIDAGKKSENMVVVGEEGKHTSHKAFPVVLSDLFLRIGGVKNVHTETDTALVIHSDDTVGDNFWLWRADHSQGVAWEDTQNPDGSVSYGNPAKTGLLVYGDRVQCYALMVEHFEGYQTDWRGNDGTVVMYQSETPYRVPSQDKWMSHGGEKNGCASYRVADSVTSHRAYGIGVYLVNYSGVNLQSAMEAPERGGVVLEHLVTTCFAAQGGASITYIINALGGTVRDGVSAAYLARFPVEIG